MAKQGAKAPKKKAAAKAPSKRRPKPAAPKPIKVAEVSASIAELDELARAVADDGGTVLCRYREPYGARAVALVALPIEKVEPTAFQRDISAAHVKKLARSIEKVARFLDPVIV